jgi:uncharacterized protein YndB with AHSA1/START domain
MTRIVSATTIIRPIGDVFDYVTTPGHWPEWHPSSLAVSGATDHALAVGEQVTEEFRVAGRRGTVVWTVREREAPGRWLIEGQIVSGREGTSGTSGTSGTVAYTLSPVTGGGQGGTRFERVFTYPTPTLLIALLDALVIRRRIRAESAEAVRRLKARLEANP